MTDRTDRAEQNFPLLRPYPTLEELVDLKCREPLFWRELERLSHFIAKVLSFAKKKKKIEVVACALRDILGVRGKDREIYRVFNEALKDAQIFIRDIVAKLPIRFRGILNSEYDIAEEEDFISLLEKYRRLCDELKTEDSALIRKREFTIRRLIVFAIILFDLKIHARRLQLSGSSRQIITSYLERRFFDSDVSIDKTIVAFHNPDDGFRVECWYFEEDLPENLKIKPGWVKTRYEITFRRFTRKGIQYLVYFSYRDKDPYSHLLKMLRKDIRDPRSSALDWRGFKLVFLNDEDINAGLDKLGEEVFYFPGVTWKLQDGRFFRETTNRFSAKRHRAKKFVTSIRGEPVEVIIETIVNHLNGIVSKAPENHELYRRRQLVKSALPLVFPYDIYRIDWEEYEEEIISFSQN